MDGKSCLSPKAKRLYIFSYNSVKWEVFGQLIQWEWNIASEFEGMFLPVNFFRSLSFLKNKNCTK